MGLLMDFETAFMGLADEQTRSAVYWLCIRDGRHDELTQCLIMEPDRKLAAGFVGTLADELSPLERDRLLDRLPFDLLSERLSERVLWLNAVDLLPEEPGELGVDFAASPDWVQRRIVSRDQVPTWVLDLLAAEGRTKRVRAAAGQLLRRA